MAADDRRSRFRKLAEQRVESQVNNATATSLEDARALIHELRVHQIELELQNEALRTAQLELEASRRSYIDLYEFSPVGLLTLDDEGQLLAANLTFARMLEIDRDRLIRRSLTDFIDSSAQDSFHLFYQKLRRTQQPQQAQILCLVPGKSPLAVRLEGIQLSEQPRAYRVAVSDMTGQRLAEARHLELIAERQRVKVLAEFVRDVSHELRTPITIIMTGLYLVGKYTNTEQRLAKVDEITRHLLYLTQVLDQLQQMAVLDSTNRLELQPGNINVLIQEVLASLQPGADKKQIQLTRHLADHLPVTYLHDGQMQHALICLLDNALRFSLTGGTISVTTFHRDKSVIVEIEDNGVGIDASALPRIFERFFKADPSRQNAGFGAGLGLSIARHIIELHHGSIQASSIPGLKTVFRIQLPGV